MASRRLTISSHGPDAAHDVELALESLRVLAPDWDGYGAPKIDAAVIEAAASFLAGLPEDLLSRPTVVPMSNGTLQLEWHDGTRSLELEFESPSSIRYLQWHPEQRIEEEDTFPVTNADKTTKLIRWFVSGAGQ